MAFDLTQRAFESLRDDEIDFSDIPQLTAEQLAQFRPMYTPEEITILQNAPTDEFRNEIFRTAMKRLKQESKQKT